MQTYQTDYVYRRLTFDETRQRNKLDNFNAQRLCKTQCVRPSVRPPLARPPA